MKTLAFALALFLTFAAAATTPVAQDWEVKLAPFDALRWPEDGDVPEVHLADGWYRWRALDDVAVADLVLFCKERWGSRWRKRVGEDLVEALVLMGHAPGASVRLELVDLESGAELVREDVPMTKENRRAVLEHNRSGASSGAPVVRRVEREHALEIAPAFAPLARPLANDAWPGSPTLARAQAEQDLDQLEWAIEHTHSYRDLRGIDWRAAFDALRAGLPERIAIEGFAVQLAKLTALFGDGHAGVHGVDGLLPGACLPFLMEETRAGVVAYLPDRSALLDPEHPHVVALDGRALQEWISLAASLVPVGSGTNVRFRALRSLRAFDWARLEAGLAPGAPVQVELASADGRATRVLELELAAHRPIHGAWPRRSSGMIEEDVGYLRIDAMNDDEDDLRAVVDAMDAFRGTRGLVIDVRGNGGGSRDILRVLLPYFLAPDAPPRVVNVAAYRLTPDDARDAREGYLANRGLFPASAARWSDDERAAIAACTASFAPDWKLPARDFSAWHYCVIGAADAGERRYRYERPVVVLSDTACFSATDVFLGAFAGLPGVTLIGAPSGGGSGRTQSVRLAHSGLELRLSTMASFRPDGRRYDGRGVEPDVRVVPMATDVLVDGTDAALEAALERIRGSD